MDYLADVLACGGMVALELIGIFIAALLIQGITLWTTGFNIYKYMDKVLIKNYLK